MDSDMEESGQTLAPNPNPMSAETQLELRKLVLQKFARGDNFNWYVCIKLPSLVIFISIWMLFLDGEQSFNDECDDDWAKIPVFCYNAVVALLQILILTVVLAFEDDIELNYRVAGRSKIPEKSVQVGHNTTFSVWCNMASAFYFTVASIAGILSFLGLATPTALCIAANTSWSIVFPMGFLVNIAVSCFVIPQLKRANQFETIWHMTQVVPQFLQNGYVLFVAIEACIAAPSIEIGSLPMYMLFGAAYVIFSLVFFHRTGIFHYFFLDPRYKRVKTAYGIMLLLLIAIYLAGSAAVYLAAQSYIAGALIIAAALGVSTFYSRDAKAPDDEPLYGAL